MKKRIPFLAFALVILVAAPSGLAAPQEPPPGQPEVSVDLVEEDVVYLTSTAHLDTQWRWTIQDTIERFIPNTLRGNFAHFERWPGYVFTFEGAFRYELAREYYPEEYDRLKKFVARGNWRVGGASIDAVDVNVPSPESLFRHILYGNLFFEEEFGKTSYDIFLPDCFGFGYALPSVAAHGGLLGFSTQKLTWGSSVGIPYPLCRWKGVDGSEIVAALDAESYVAGIEEDVSRSEVWSEKLRRIREETGLGIDYHYFGVGDQGGAVRPDVVDWVRRSVEGGGGGEGAGPNRVVLAGSDQLFRDLAEQPEARAKLPVYDGELLMTTHAVGCYTSQAAMKRWYRKCELLADAAERAAVLADWLGEEPYPRRKLREAWNRLLWHGFHDDLTGTSIPQAYVFSWNDLLVCADAFEQVLNRSVATVARALDTRAEGVPLLVYNPLSIEREDVVEAWVEFEGGPPAAVRVVDPDDLERKAQVGETTARGTRVVFEAKVPSIGFSVFDLRPAAAPGPSPLGLGVSERHLENGRYVVRLDEGGSVASIRDKSVDEELLSGPIRLELHDNPSPRWPAWEILHETVSSPPRAVVGGPAEVRVVESGPARVALEVTRRAEGSVFVETIRLAAGGARVEFDTEVIWRTPGTLLKVAFPWSFASPLATYDLGLGTIDRGNNTEKLYEVPAQRWASVGSQEAGVGAAVLNDCKYGWDKPDDATLRLTLIHTPVPGGYRDQANQDIGRHRLAYAIFGHGGDWAYDRVPWEAERFNQPLRAFVTDPHPSPLQPPLDRSFSFLEVEDGVAVKALKKAERTDDVVLRLQEVRGRQAPGVIVDMAAPFRLANEVNGAEGNPRHVRPYKGLLATNLGPYRPRTYALDLDPPDTKLEGPGETEIPLPHDTDVTSLPADRTDGAMDAEGRTYPGDLLPPAVRAGGVHLALGPVNPGEPNATACRGQEIPLPEGEWNRLHLLAASSKGDSTGRFRFGETLATAVVPDWTAPVGQWDSRIVDGRYIGTDRFGGLDRGYRKGTPIGWVGTHRHSPEGDDAYVFCYLFHIALDVPPGASSVTLPENPGIKLFAATVAADPGAATRPAQPLFDTMEAGRPPPPAVRPPGGEHDDTVVVDLEPLYRVDSHVHYTLDGSEPTEESPRYTWASRDADRGGIVLHESVTLRARHFDPDGRPGYEAVARFVVDDRTPPSILSVRAMDDPETVWVTFSEPVDGTSALEAACGIDPGVAITGRKLMEDGRTLRLGTAPLVPEREYRLRIDGIRDRSPAGNAAGLEAEFLFVESSAGAPLLRLRLDDGAGEQVRDSSGRGFRGERRGAEWAEGRVGGALAFDGVDDCVIVADRPELNPTDGLTIAAWIRPEDWKGNRRILQKGVDDSQYRLLHEGGTLRFHLSGVGMLDCEPPAPGAWHHVAGTYDGVSMRIYIDGALAAERKARGPITTTTDPVYVGTKTLGVPPGDFFKGRLDEVLLYDRGLTAEEIASLASAPDGKEGDE